ncbi:MAG: bifunctional alpha/beta hydrolase/OsmC family protein [Planctomycetes bacterium]|nr:bifunctional alpha/beta hydrolase/OsmC family protein [Planctomycetota bacterium]
MSQPVTFPASSGALLAGRLSLPPGTPRAWALFAHCFTCGKDIAAARRISEALAARGFGVLRFDFTGLGQSEGEFAETTFSSDVADLAAAAAFLRAEHAAPTILIGHSLGGSAVLAAAANLPEIVAVVTIGAPFEPAHVAHLIEKGAPDLREKGEGTIQLGGRPFRIKAKFLEDLEAQNQPERIAALGRALLVLHAPGDEIVGIDEARKIYQAAKHPKSFVSLDDADHLLSRPRDANYAADLIAAWAARYLPESETDEPEGTVRVEGGPSGFAQAVQAGPHSLRADEPRRVGGTDTGPAPYDLLLAGLGACTSMTLRMYADRKGWPLDGVQVRLKHDKIHAKDCEECETKTGRVDRIQREVTILGPDLDAAQRKRLLEIADRCPVHRTLESEIRIETREA